MSSRGASGLILYVVLLFLAGCATTTTAGGPTWVTFPDGEGGQGITLEEWLKKHPFEAGQEIANHELSRGESSSSHLVVVRKEEKLHVHKNHELVAILLKGEGTLTLGRRELHWKPGGVLSIPRGIPHAFVNQSSGPAVAYAVFVPAFDGKDTVPVER